MDTLSLDRMGCLRCQTFALATAGQVIYPGIKYFDHKTPPILTLPLSSNFL